MEGRTGEKRPYLLASWMTVIDILICLPRKIRMRIRITIITVPMIPTVDKTNTETDYMTIKTLYTTSLIIVSEGRH